MSVNTYLPSLGPKLRRCYNRFSSTFSGVTAALSPGARCSALDPHERT